MKDDEVEVRISHCGVCYSDIHLIDNDWGISKYPFVPGHEIVGMVTAVGSRVSARSVGQRVGSAGRRPPAASASGASAAKNSYVRSSSPLASGVMAVTRTACGSTALLRAHPDALESEHAAPLLCAGITVYSPLRNLGVRPSSRVGIIGIGGLGHIGIQFARAFGAEVTAFSTSKDKEAEAKELGAHNFINTRDTGALKKVGGSFDLLLTTVNADQDWAGYVNALRPQGNAWYSSAFPRLP